MRLAAIALVVVFAGVGPAYAGPITIPESGPGSLYPSTIDMPPVDRAIENVEVEVTDLVHEFPDELDIALTGPGDRTVMLMSDTGAATGCSSPPDVRFSMRATEPVPESPLPCNGIYLPTDLDEDETDSDVFAPPAPAEPFDTTLGVFNSLLVGGRWSLRVMDDTAGDGGSISTWRLRFDTRFLGRARIRASQIRIPEAQPTLTVEVERTGGSAAAPLAGATVDWAVLPEPCDARAPAILGQEYVTRGGSVAFGPGQTVAHFDVGLLDDRIPEPTECFRVALTGRSGDAMLSETIPEILEVSLSNDDRAASTPAVMASPPQRILRAKAVKVRATSEADGTLSATGRIAVPGGAAAIVRLKPARPVAVTAGQRVTLNLGLTRRAARAVRRALKRRPKLVATIKVTATDLAGGTASRTVKVRLRR